jgi:hypothetical protein
MAHIMTLREWQTHIVHKSEYIVQASTTDGLDGITAPSIGMCYTYVSRETPEETPEEIIKDHCVLCAINTGTDQRRRGAEPLCRKTIAETLSNNGFENTAIEKDKYFEELPKYRFVISPEGNGIDCHRHYEALMAKCIPIVEDSALIRAKYGNAPILYTRDYSEITQEYLEQKYAEMLDQRWDFSRLFMSSWSREEQLLIKYRGNFWCERLAGRPWYIENVGSEGPSLGPSAQINTHPFYDSNKVPCVYVLGMAKVSL